MGAGDVVRWVYVLPSERVTSWVNVYGRFGRRMRVACRHCICGIEGLGGEARRRGIDKDILNLFQ